MPTGTWLALGARKMNRTLLATMRTSRMLATGVPGRILPPMSTLNMQRATRGLRDFSTIDMFFLFIQCFVGGYCCTEVIPFISNVSYREYNESKSFMVLF
ncbi:hypothetical protein KC19_VG055700 [Ceratodon purpureus]|uniref:Uncharacterized protein n=1 Tax=Ceratodon purpureus TaxID=3225 RepID=A0A8T0HM98_CERPU|nr:hypothetical protein KC19_VG055700 [Ceratodon purpureus]